MNFARRTECNKCGTPSPTGANDRGGGSSGGGYNRGGGGGGYGSNRGGRSGNFDGGRGNDYNSGRSNNNDGRGGGGNRGGSFGANQGREEGGYGQLPPPTAQSYGGGGGSYPPTYNSYGGNANYGTDAVPPPSSYTGGPTSYPPSYGGNMGGYGGDNQGDARSGRAGPPAGYDNRSGFGGAAAESPVAVKQCDDNCGDTCDNSRIYISNLPPDVTIEELRDLFGGIGQVMFCSIDFCTCTIYSVIFLNLLSGTFCMKLLFQSKLSLSF